MSRIKKSVRFIIFIVFSICLIMGVVYLMQHARNLLNSDTKVNLMEIVTQNRDVISSQLKVELNNLNNFSREIGNYVPGDSEVTGADLQEVMTDKILQNGETDIFVADKNGTAYYSDGNICDIAGREYFKLAIEGISNISDKLISRVDGLEKFIISVPLYNKHKEIVGTVQKGFTHDEMYKLCSVSLFSSKGYMYIINSEGYALLHTSHKDCQQLSTNYFRDLYAWKNTAQSDKLAKSIKDNKDGFFEATIDGKKVFSAFTPIDEVHDWYLITSVPMEAVSANGETVIEIFYVILLSIIVFFMVGILYFMHYKNKQKASIEDIAFIDPVTGGNTYSKFVMKAGETLEAHPGRQFAILKFDMDNFRFVNSYYGFEYGDKLLCQIYQRVAEMLKGSEITARITGDNFVVFLEDFAEERVQNILNSLDDEEFSIYLSAGLYVIKNPRESVRLMVDKASTAARSIKGVINKNLEYYSEKFDASSLKNEQLKRAVSIAIANSEFVPFYQPKVDIETGDIVGAEALARWRTSDNRLISPGEFIPMCEQTGIIVEIDMIIFEKVLRFQQNAIFSGERCIPISVNFSRVHLLDGEFLEKIEQLLDQYQVPHDMVEIEITESAIFDNRDIILKFTKELKKMGIRIDMDDFGSGYSSLNMLKDIPIDILKIDREFLIASSGDERRDIIFKSVVEMAKELGIEVVVEGVEFEENVALMRRCGCRIAQGYYYAKPMDEQQFINFTGRAK